MKFIKTQPVNGVTVISTTELCKRLGFNISASKITEMTHVKPFIQRNSGVYWRDSDFKIICTRMAGALLTMGNSANKSPNISGVNDVTQPGFHP